jgi:predicted  nucleic acid-binding Zn-ribbon protein
MKAALVLAALLASPACAEESAANPIRKVVSMLQNMQKRVEADGTAEQELYDKFMCYCKNGAAALEKSIADAGDAIPELGANIKEGQSQLAQLKEDLKQTQTAREAAKAAIAEAAALREKTAAEYDADATKLKGYLSDLDKAITALQGGKVEAFLQTTSASQLRNLVEETETMSDIDRSDVTAFLTNDSSNPDTAMIVGILKQMADRMTANLGELTSKEEASAKSHDDLVAAKTAEVQALTDAIEEKPSRIGELGLEIVQMKKDLSDTEESVVDDKKFAADLEKNCATKEAEWAEVCKTRSEEILALADTIKILNDDDALEMFKKTLPGASASFMQIEVSEAALRTRALAILQDAKVGKKADRHRVDFVMLALRGEKVGFGKVVKMIDDMVALMAEEAANDSAKKAHCEKEFDVSDDEKKVLERTEGKLEAAISDRKESVAALKEEMAALTEGIVALDKSVAEATDQRREENSDYKTLMMNNQAAKELLEFAKNRLNKFYNPPAMLMQISAHRSKADPGAPPAAPGAHKKQDGNGVIGMIDTLVKDLDTEMTEAKINEKNAQEEYEEMMADSASKRADDTKSVADTNGAQADGAALIVSKSRKLTSTKKEIMATHEYIGQLHAQCDWLLKFYDTRAEARNGEVDSLKKAKAVLSGAGYSLVQTSARTFLHK